MTPRPRLLPLGAAVLAAALAACDQRMIDQPRYEVWEAAELFPDGSAVQRPAPGAVARGDPAWLAELATRPEMTPALLERGRERYTIFCAPCHSPTGDGDGMIVQRGFPRPPSYHIPRLREAPDSHYLSVIANGYGVMYEYGSRVSPANRWAIVAYIRALQLSRAVEIAALPPAVRAALEERDADLDSGREAAP